MNILASCSIEEAREKTGKLQIEEEEGKHSKVLLNVVVEDINDVNINTLLENNNIKCISTKTVPKDSIIIDKFKDNIFIDYSLNSYKSSTKKELPEGVIRLVTLPDGFSDMREVYDICESDDRVRVKGGYLLALEGVRIGRYPKDKEKSVLYEEVYDNFLEVSLTDLSDIKEVVAKVKKSSIKKLKSIGEDGVEKVKRVVKDKVVKAPTKVNKDTKRNALANLFGDSEEVGF